MSDYICSTCGAKRNSFEELFAHKASCRGLVTPPNPGIAEEIWKALEAATPDWYDNGNEIVSKGNPRVGIGGFMKDEDNHLAANAPEWLRYLLQQIEQQKAEIEAMRLSRDFEIKESNKAKHLLQQYREENERLKNEIKSHGPEGRNYTNAQYVELRLENERLRGEHEQVKAERDDYRKVLEWFKEQNAGGYGWKARHILYRYKERGDSLDER